MTPEAARIIAEAKATADRMRARAAAIRMGHRESHFTHPIVVVNSSIPGVTLNSGLVVSYHQILAAPTDA